MNPFKKVFCRIYQTLFHLALPLLPYRLPERHNNVTELPTLLRELKKSSVLLVTDSFLREAGLTWELEEALAAAQIRCAVYDRTRPNPTVENVEEALALYREAECSAMIAFGGGSSIDCAKAVGARVAYPRRTMDQIKGNLRVLRSLPTLIAIPTTAGTGSETTLTAVITDTEKKHKYTMNAFPLIPHYAVLDPKVTYTLPPSLTATTGMDALTHAVEVYIGRSTSKETRAMSIEAAQLIFANIETAYREGTNETARRNMLRAAFLAGAAFSKSYVGYVHAVAHSLGGCYNIPHGLANSVLLPIFLEAYGDAIAPKLRDLAVAVGLVDAQTPAGEAAAAFIRAVRELNARMGIPATLKGIRPEDIPQMAAHADREGNPLYPVPVLMDRAKLETFYVKVADWGSEHAEA